MSHVNCLNLMISQEFMVLQWLRWRGFRGFWNPQNLRFKHGFYLFFQNLLYWLKLSNEFEATALCISLEKKPILCTKQPNFTMLLYYLKVPGYSCTHYPTLQKFISHIISASRILPPYQKVYNLWLILLKLGENDP